MCVLCNCCVVIPQMMLQVLSGEMSGATQLREISQI